MTLYPSLGTRSRIHLLFLGLAGLNLLALVLSFGLFHRLAAQDEAAVLRDRHLAEEIARFDRLEDFGSALESAAKDLSLGGDVARERKRVADAATTFRREAQSLQNALPGDGSDPVSRTNLDAAISAATKLEHEAGEAITAFAGGDLPRASRALANQAYARVVEPLQEAEDALRERETASFRGQQRAFAKTVRQEAIIGVALLLLTAAIVVYGRRAAREMITARERELYVTQLQEREAALETAIRERDRQTRNLEEAQSIAAVGSWEWDVASDTLQWSQELRRMFGVSPEKVGTSGEDYLTAVHPADRERVERTIRESIKSRRPFEIEHRAVRPDGTVAILSSRGSIEPDAAGNVVRMHGIAHDISAIRASETELQQSEERFQLATRATNDVIWDRDVVNNSVWVNEGWTTQFGYPNAGYIDIDVWKSVIHPDDLSRVMDSMQRAMDGDAHSWSDDYRLLTQHGPRSVLDRGLIVRDHDGKPIRIIGAITDITDRKEAELSIARLHRKTELILNSAADGLFGMDLDGISTFVNPAAARILGYEPEELVGKQMHDTMHFKHEDGTPYPWADCPSLHTVQDGAPRSSTGVFWTKSGKSVPVDFTVTAMMDEKTHVAGAVMTFRDISERLVIDRMKNEFVSTVSHELRTPLTSIRGALGLLVTGRLGTFPEKAARLLSIASSNTDRLVRLINDILDIERMESGKVTLTKVPADAADLVRQAADVVRQLVEQAGLTIETSTVPAALFVDPDRIVQTLTNLIGNAIKFSPAQSLIRVTSEVVGNAVLFRVIDQGRGIPPEKLEMVFERFKQVDASDSRDKGGSGLGLAICRSIVRQHGGEISVRSEVGHGSEFSFTIPIASPISTESISPIEAAQERLVYICDDDEGARKTMSVLLAAHDYTAVEFDRGSDLLTAALDRSPDLILLDLFMADMNGWNTLARLKTDPRTADIPIVVVSVLSPDERDTPYIDLCSWLRKPLEEGELLEAVTSALRSGGRRQMILIVEDDADLARVIASSFERYGLEVIIASTGQQAIDLAATLVPDLVVLDLLLPEVDGFGVVDWIKDHGLWRGVPLIVYSALETSPSQRERLRLGPTEFIIKSRIGPEEFERRVLHLLSRLSKAEPRRLMDESGPVQ